MKEKEKREHPGKGSGGRTFRASQKSLDPKLDCNLAAGKRGQLPDFPLARLAPTQLTPLFSAGLCQRAVDLHSPAAE